MKKAQFHLAKQNASGTANHFAGEAGHAVLVPVAMGGAGASVPVVAEAHDEPMGVLGNGGTGSVMQAVQALDRH